MKQKLIQALLSDDKTVDIMDALQSLINELPKQSKQYKVLRNLHAYFVQIQDDELDLLEELSETPAHMEAASLRAMGLIGDTARDEQIAALILQSAQMAWVVTREGKKAVLN